MPAHRALRATASLVVALAIFPALARAQHAGHDPARPYAGQQARAVTAFSEEELAELRRGGGMGLAKPAELNGYPGPAHVLELARELELDDQQEAAVRAVFDAMQRRAIVAGERLIAAEAALDAAFRERTVTIERLRALLAEAEAARAELRLVHLAAHLETRSLLRPAQIARYDTLRGYRVDPCAGGPPSGHDPELWRRHTGCP